MLDVHGFRPLLNDMQVYSSVHTHICLSHSRTRSLPSLTKPDLLVQTSHKSPRTIVIRRWQQTCRKLALLGKGLIHEEASVLYSEHWIEALDRKHRCGSDLKHYYEHWKSSDTRENFFDWLDWGEGASIDLPTCSRALMESHQVQYCDVRERLLYEVQIEGGVLFYKMCGKPLHTDIHSNSADLDEKPKWIFVMSVDRRLFVGLKRRGKFHHSSFLSGASVLAAGRMVCAEGRLVSLAPHSGHYRTSPSHFRRLLDTFVSLGVDLSSVRVEWYKTSKTSKQTARWNSH